MASFKSAARNKPIASETWRSGFFKKVDDYLVNDVLPEMIRYGVPAAETRALRDRIIDAIGAPESSTVVPYVTLSTPSTKIRMTTEAEVKDFLTHTLPGEVDILVARHSARNDNGYQAVRVLGSKLSNLQAVLAAAYAESIAAIRTTKDARNQLMQVLASGHERQPRSFFDRWYRAIEKALAVDIKDEDTV